MGAAFFGSGSGLAGCDATLEDRLGSADGSVWVFFGGIVPKAMVDFRRKEWNPTSEAGNLVYES